MKFDVFASVVGTKFIGTFDAETAEGAIALAEESDETSVIFCHQCARQCEDPQAIELKAEVRG